MGTELHPVVQLLLARMKSHPEEFQAGMNRWDWILHKVQDNGTEAELEALNEALRPIRLDEAHEQMMDELCNGDERRRKSNEVLRIDEFGNMGIGTKTPNTRLQVSTKEGNSK